MVRHHNLTCFCCNRLEITLGYPSLKVWEMYSISLEKHTSGKNKCWPLLNIQPTLIQRLLYYCSKITANPAFLVLWSIWDYKGLHLRKNQNRKDTSNLQIYKIQGAFGYYLTLLCMVIKGCQVWRRANCPTMGYETWREGRNSVWWREE